MSLEILDTNFSGLSTGDFIFKVSTIANKLEVHPHFQQFPEYVPGPARLRELLEQYKQCIDAAANGDRVKKEEKKAIRVETERAATMTAQHVVMVSLYKKDPTVLHETGFDLKHRAYSRSSSTVPGRPSKFSAKHGRASGTIVVTVGREPGVAMFELQVCEGEPIIDETSWRSLGMYGQCRNELTGFEPGKKYHFRARNYGTTGTSGWSTTISLIAL